MRNQIAFVFMTVVSLLYPVWCYGPERYRPIVRSPELEQSKQQLEELPTVVVVTTGGTIAEKASPKTGGAVPALTGHALVDAVPGLDKLANIQVVPFSNIDSSHMTPEMWNKLSETSRIAPTNTTGFSLVSVRSRK